MLVGARWQTRVQESNIFGERADKWVSSLQASLEPRPANAHRECPRKQPRSQHTPKSAHWPTLLEAESTGVRAHFAKAFLLMASPFAVLPLTLVFQRPLLLLSYPNPADPAREGQNEKEDGRMGERSEERKEERRQREKRMEEWREGARTLQRHGLCQALSKRQHFPELSLPTSGRRSFQYPSLP